MKTRNIGPKPLTKSTSKLAVFAGALAAATLALSACSSSGGQAQSGSAAGEAPPPEITLGEYFEHETHWEVDGLTGQRIASSVGVAARWDYLPGEQPFNEVLAEVVTTHVDRQAESRDAVYTPEAHEENPDWLDRGCVAGSTSLSGREILDSPELSGTNGEGTSLTVACDTVLASGKNYGEKLRFVRGDASEVVSDQVEVLYTNTETGDVARGRDLLSSEGVANLYDAAFELLKLERPMSDGAPVAPSEETLANLHHSLSNVGFNSAGDMSVTVDQATIADFGAEGDAALPTTFVIPAGRAHIDLTELGQEISRSVAEGEEWSGPAGVKPGQEYVDCGLSPCVAVTYDDGPSFLTPEVLDAYGELPYAAATFFVLGQNIAGQEDIIERIHADGHELANHSWSHPAFTTLSDEAISQEMNQTNEALKAITGEDPVLYRPPYGDLNDRTLATANMPAILWSLDTNDWQQPGYEPLVADVVNNSQPDDIVLMHDIHDTTTAAADEIATRLLERGFTLVTVSQLFGDTELAPVAITSAAEYGA